MQVHWASGAAWCATQRPVASPAPARTTMPFGYDDLYDEAASQAHRAALCAPAASADARARARSARDRRRRIARQGDLFHVGVAAAGRGLRYQCCGSACRSPASGAIATTHTTVAARDGREIAFAGASEATTCAFPPCPRSPRSSAASRSRSATGSRIGGTVFSRVRVGDADRAEAARRRSQGRRRRVVHDGRRASRTTAASARARSARTSRRGTSTSRSSSSCARTPATIAAARTT